MAGGANAASAYVTACPLPDLLGETFQRTQADAIARLSRPMLRFSCECRR